MTEAIWTELNLYEVVRSTMESDCYKYAYYSTHFVGAFVSYKTISITIHV